MPHQGRRTDSGFTLVELLVVMVILGVLAAIAVPAFLSQQQKAHEATVKADIAAITKELTGFYVDGRDDLMLSSGDAPATWMLTRGTTVVASGRLSPRNAVSESGEIESGTSYCIAVVPDRRGARTWKATQDGLEQGDC